MLKTHKFARKPFYVDAVRVSEANMEEVAKWCEGEIQTSEEGTFISVKVYRPLNERQSQAFIGDWVLFAGSGFKVYTPKAFDKSFEKVRTLTKAQADEAGIKVPHEPKSKPAGRKPVPTAPKKRTQRQLTTNVGQAIREAQEAKQAEEPKVIEKAEIHSISLDTEPGPGGGKVESVEYPKETGVSELDDATVVAAQERIAETERREQQDKPDDLLSEVLRQPLPGDQR